MRESLWIVTCRGFISTLSPALAYSYSFFPFIFIAEYIGGICFISPVKFFSAFCTSFFVGSFFECVSFISPVISSVSLVFPRTAVVL